MHGFDSLQIIMMVDIVIFYEKLSIEFMYKLYGYGVRGFDTSGIQWLSLSLSHFFLDKPCIYVISSYTLQYSSSFSYCSLMKLSFSPSRWSIELRFFRYILYR